MADITNPVRITAELITVIERVKGQADFTHERWGSECLEGLRKLIRDHYRAEQRGRCAYCKGPLSLQSAANCHVEHIAPKSKYLSFIFEPKNLCVVCADCNEIKREQEVHNEAPDTVNNGSRRQIYPRAASAFKIVHPHYDVFDDHIEIFGSFYGDKTDKGYFTIGACKLNRRLRKFGWEVAFEDADVANAAQSYLDTKEPLARARSLQALKRMLVLV